MGAERHWAFVSVNVGDQRHDRPLDCAPFDLSRLRQMTDQSLPKPLASALATAYAHAADARKAVEHRLASIPPQEQVVAEWQKDTVGRASHDYPGHAVNSYPVQTRMSWEIAKLSRYREELPQRLQAFARALQHMETVAREVDQLAKTGIFKAAGVSRPKPSSALSQSAWPESWPMSFEEARTAPLVRNHRPSIEPVMLTPRKPDQMEFFILCGERKLKMTARYGSGVEHFRSEFEEYAEGQSSTRWRAILEAIRCDIRWPLLEQHLIKPSPWLPQDLVGEEFGLRGSLAKREALSDLLVQLSPNAARWYLAQMPGRISTQYAPDRYLELCELVAAGLVRVGEMMSVEEMLQGVPFSQVKILFTLAGLKAPASFSLAASRFLEVRAVRDERYLRAWLEELLDPIEYLVVLEPPFFTREERLGPRARANVMVSSLAMLAEGNRGALSIFE